MPHIVSGLRADVGLAEPASRPWPTFLTHRWVTLGRRLYESILPGCPHTEIRTLFHECRRRGESERRARSACEPFDAPLRPVARSQPVRVAGVRAPRPLGPVRRRASARRVFLSPPEPRRDSVGAPVFFRVAPCVRRGVQRVAPRAKALAPACHIIGPPAAAAGRVHGARRVPGAQCIQFGPVYARWLHAPFSNSKWGSRDVPLGWYQPLARRRDATPSPRERSIAW
jgi:hypothetical protein